MQLAMPICLVNVQENTTVKVRLLNPFPESRSIKQDTVFGTACKYNGECETLLEIYPQSTDFQSHWDNLSPNSYIQIPDLLSTVMRYKAQLSQNIRGSCLMKRVRAGTR